MNTNRESMDFRFINQERSLARLNDLHPLLVRSKVWLIILRSTLIASLKASDSRNRYDIDIRAIYHAGSTELSGEISPPRLFRLQGKEGHAVQGGAEWKPVLRGIPNTAGL